MQRTAEAPPQAALTQRTTEVPPQAVPTRFATPYSRIWRPLAAALVCGSWATHWRSRVSWGPTCGPSHIDLLQVDAISGVSRPAFIPWAGPTCAGPTGARYLPAPKGL